MTIVPVRQIVFTALFAALFVIMSAIKISLPLVPITLQTLAVMLAGAFLGPWLGFLSIFLVVALTALGLPLLGGHGGIAVIQGVTGGFILAFPVSALLVGFAVRRLVRSGLLQRSKTAAIIVLFVIFELLTTFLVYAGGVPWFAMVTDQSIAASLPVACYPFLVGDTIKAAVAAIAMAALYGYAPVFRADRQAGGIRFAD